MRKLINVFGDILYNIKENGSTLFDYAALGYGSYLLGCYFASWQLGLAIFLIGCANSPNRNE